MGFTIEDMLTVSRDRYKMKIEAGSGGWANSISWLMMLEDITITHNFRGKELAVTTGLGFQSEEKLMKLAEQLVKTHASGLLINTGKYILSLPESLCKYCNENDLPLLTVPWDVILADMIKDLSVRIFLQSDTDEQISNALIHAIEDPQAREIYSKHLLPHFDVDGTFQIILLYGEGLDTMDTVERRRLSYRMQVYLSNITHNAHFFYYDSSFVLMVNDVEQEYVRDVLDRFYLNLHRRMPGTKIVVGVSDLVTDISRLRTAYRRAQEALHMALDFGKDRQYFDQMGIYRLLYSISDRELLQSFCEDMLHPLLEYDREHDALYLETLERYLKNDGSIRAVSEEMYTHRNTVLYRMNNIRNLLGVQLDTQEEKTRYLMACLIHHMSLRDVSEDSAL